MHQFTKCKNDFDKKYNSKIEFECFLPEDTSFNKISIIKGKFGKPNEEYYKWQFLSSIVNSGMYAKDFIGTEVYFPKGNKKSAPIKFDGAIFDDKTGLIIIKIGELIMNKKNWTGFVII